MEEQVKACDNFVLDECVCDDCAVPKAQCANCGYDKTEHVNEKKLLIFTCPKCGWDVIEVTVINAVVTQIVKVNEKNLIDYEKTKIQDASEMEYGCSCCGEKMENNDGSFVSCEEELVEWLKNHQ